MLYLITIFTFQFLNISSRSRMDFTIISYQKRHVPHEFSHEHDRFSNDFPIARDRSPQAPLEGAVQQLIPG